MPTVRVSPLRVRTKQGASEASTSQPAAQPEQPASSLLDLLGTRYKVNGGKYGTLITTKATFFYGRDAFVDDYSRSYSVMIVDKPRASESTTHALSCFLYNIIIHHSHHITPL